MQQLTKGQVVYYARILPPVGMYEVYDLKIRTVEEEYFVGLDKDTQHAYLFENAALEKNVFINRKDALKVVKEAEKNKKTVSEEIYYEEY